MTAMLTLNFSLSELTVSDTAAKRGLDNTPPDVVLPRLRTLALTLEKVRAQLNHAPIIVSSGYRSPALNKIVSGTNTSAHCEGWAVDFIAPKFGTPLSICRLLVNLPDFRFDQLIYEGSWIHLSIDPRQRQQVLTMRDGKYFPGLVEM